MCAACVRKCGAVCDGTRAGECARYAFCMRASAWRVCACLGVNVFLRAWKLGAGGAAVRSVIPTHPYPRRISG